MSKSKPTSHQTLAYPDHELKRHAASLHSLYSKARLLVPLIIVRSGWGSPTSWGGSTNYHQPTNLFSRVRCSIFNGQNRGSISGLHCVVNFPDRYICRPPRRQNGNVNLSDNFVHIHSVEKRTFYDFVLNLKVEIKLFSWDWCNY